MIHAPEVVLFEPFELILVPLDPVVVDDQRLRMVGSRVPVNVRVVEEVSTGREHVVRDDGEPHPGVLLVHQGRPKRQL